MPVRYSALERALQDAVHAWLRSVMQPEHELAVFGLYTSGEFNFLRPTADTAAHWHTLEHRWSPADWVLHEVAQDGFEEVDALLLEGWRDGYGTFDVDPERLFVLIVGVLADARQRAFTGTDVLMGLVVAGGHQWTDHSVEMIHPPEVALQYR